MDRSNYNALHRLAPSNGKAKIFLLGDYHDNKGIIIRDPYFVSCGAYNIYYIHYLLGVQQYAEFFSISHIKEEKHVLVLIMR